MYIDAYFTMNKKISYSFLYSESDYNNNLHNLILFIKYNLELDITYQPVIENRNNKEDIDYLNMFTLLEKNNIPYQGAILYLGIKRFIEENRLDSTGYIDSKNKLVIFSFQYED